MEPATGKGEREKVVWQIIWERRQKAKGKYQKAKVRSVAMSLMKVWPKLAPRLLPISPHT
jgi:hypothetical protein